MRDFDRAKIARVVSAARTAGRLSSMKRGGIITSAVEPKAITDAGATLGTANPV